MEITNYENKMQKQDKSTTAEMMVSRQAQEVQAAMVIAKRFPRDEFEAYNRIMKACERPLLAENAMYEYPRGGTMITGPSIRLAEALAQAWGNIDFGIMELDQTKGESTMMAYAWDLETNTRQTKIFQVRHERKARGRINKLEDPRDIYEMVANQGARRMRACILGIIPGDVVEAATEKCKETIIKGNKTPLGDRIKKMIVAFDSEFGVSKEAIEEHIGCSAEAFTENSLIRLRGVYKSLKDGMAKREDYFEIKGAKKDIETDTESPFNEDEFSGLETPFDPENTDADDEIDDEIMDELEEEIKKETEEEIEGESDEAEQTKLL